MGAMLLVTIGKKSHRAHGALLRMICSDLPWQHRLEAEAHLSHANPARHAHMATEFRGR